MIASPETRDRGDRGSCRRDQGRSDSQVSQGSILSAKHAHDAFHYRIDFDLDVLNGFLEADV